MLRTYRSGDNGIPWAPALVSQPVIVQLVALLKVDNSVAHLGHIQPRRLLPDLQMDILYSRCSIPVAQA